MKKIFEGHASKEPTELLIIAAAQGNLKQIKDVCKMQGVNVSTFIFMQIIKDIIRYFPYPKKNPFHKDDISYIKN